MSYLQVTKTLYVDALPLAEQIEAQYGMYLLPPELGYYLPTSCKPALKSGEQYYQKRTARNKVPETVEVSTLEALLAADIYTREAVLAVPQEMIKCLALQPQLPVRALAMLSAVVDHTLAYFAAWARRPAVTLEACVAEHLKEEYRARLPDEEPALALLQQEFADLKRLKDNVSLHGQLADLCDSVRNQVREFIGEDRWVMHFHRARGLDIVVEKTADFRIYQWEMEHGHEYPHRKG